MSMDVLGMVLVAGLAALGGAWVASIVCARRHRGSEAQRATERRLKLHRRDETGKVTILQPKLTDSVRSDDVIYVDESFF